MRATMQATHPTSPPEGAWSAILCDPRLGITWGVPFDDWVAEASADLRLEMWRQLGGDPDTLVVWGYPSWGQLSWQAGCQSAGVGESIDPAWPPTWWWDGERWRGWATNAGEDGYLFVVEGKHPTVAAGPYVPSRFTHPDPWSESLRRYKDGAGPAPDSRGITAGSRFAKERWEADAAVLVPGTDGREAEWLREAVEAGGMEVVPALRWGRPVEPQRGRDLAGREQRRGALAGSELLEGRRVLLVDDIVVSGVTMSDAARAVTEAGGEVAAAVCGGWTIEGRAGGRAHVVAAR